MRIYLDTSVYNRPFDDQTQPRIWLESLAFTVIMRLVEAGKVESVKSQVSDFENSRNPAPMRKRWINYYLSLADFSQNLNLEILKRAKELEKQGIDAIDALHLASAEKAQAECFITCDDAIIQKYEGRLKVLNPIKFILKEGKSRW